MLTAPRITQLTIQRHKTYGPEDKGVHTLQFHGVATGLLNLTIEVRNDLLGSTDHKNEMPSELRKIIEQGLKSTDTRQARDPQTCPE